MSVAAKVSATVDAADPQFEAFQTMDGFGTTIKPFTANDMWINDGSVDVAMTPAEQAAVLDLVYTDWAIPRMRVQGIDAVVPEGALIEPVNDNADPYVTNLAAFDFQYLDTAAAILGEARNRGVSTAWISPVQRESWMGNTTATDVAEWAEWMLAVVRRFSQQGQPLDYISLNNEPSFINNLSGAFLRDCIKDLGPRLDAEGLPNRFVIPDDENPVDALAAAQTILADATARSYVAAIATHIYSEPLTTLADLRDLAASYGLPLWMSEFFKSNGTDWIGWATLVHDLVTTYNCTAVDYLWAWFGSYDVAQLVDLNRSGTTYTGFTPLKVGYVHAQFAKYVRPGYKRIDASATGGVLVTAYRKVNSRVLVAVNPTGGAVATTITCPQLAGLTSLSATRTSAAENMATVSPAGVAGDAVSVTLPASSVTTFVL